MEGLGDQIKGKAKQIKGKVTGNRKDQVEGKAQQALGAGKQKAARAKRTLEGRIDDMRRAAAGKPHP